MKAVNRVEYNIQLGLYTFTPGCGFAILHKFEKDVLRVLVDRTLRLKDVLAFSITPAWRNVISLLNPFEGVKSSVCLRF